MHCPTSKAASVLAYRASGGRRHFFSAHLAALFSGAVSTSPQCDTSAPKQSRHTNLHAVHGGGKDELVCLKESTHPTSLRPVSNFAMDEFEPASDGRFSASLFLEHYMNNWWVFARQARMLPACNTVRKDCRLVQTAVYAQLARLLLCEGISGSEASWLLTSSLSCASSHATWLALLTIV